MSTKILVVFSWLILAVLGCVCQWRGQISTTISFEFNITIALCHLLYQNKVPMLREHVFVLLNIKFIVDHQGVLLGWFVATNVGIHQTIIVACVLGAVEATMLGLKLVVCLLNGLLPFENFPLLFFLSLRQGLLLLNFPLLLLLLLLFFLLLLFLALFF